ncbi:hypothetical protein [Bradyrhizobium shewense]|uniref:hypothetical protein n=1 Tax=Bradyrhizobium shewense TaxID=1761772 RepID=UPI00101AD65F|nr:hypothetical protein [Bradyrhizobium shewense]
MITGVFLLFGFFLLIGLTHEYGAAIYQAAQHQLMSINQVDTVLTVVLATAGIVLVALAISDLVFKIKAKRQLAQAIYHTPYSNVEYLRLFIDRPGTMSFRPLGDRDPRLRRDEDRDGDLHLLFIFLEQNRYGIEASKALFQRSREGRQRYLEDVLRIAHAMGRTRS